MRRSKAAAIVLTLVLLISLLTSCAMDSLYSISPPSWIIGEWVDENTTRRFSFASDDIIIHYTTGKNVSLKDVLRESLIENPTEAAAFYEIVRTSSEYRFRLMEMESDVNVTYKFVKVSHHTLNLITPNEAIELYKED